MKLLKYVLPGEGNFWLVCVSCIQYILKPCHPYWLLLLICHLLVFCLLLALLLLSELLYSNESTSYLFFFFLCVFFHCTMLSKDLAVLHIDVFPCRPLRDSFLKSNTRPYSIMLDLFLYQLLFYTYIILSICCCLEDTALTLPAQCTSCLQAVRLYKTYPSTYISSFICRNTFWLSKPGVDNA